MKPTHRARVSVPRRAGLLAVLAVSCAICCAIACGQDTHPPEVPGAQLPVGSLVVGDRRITVEIAATPRDRNLGLMFREQIPEDHGMLFVYGGDDVLTFWMKNTLIPLSIAFADREGRILRIVEMQPFSEEIHSSLFPARYALEMRQGWFRRNGVVAGDLISEIPEIEVR